MSAPSTPKAIRRDPITPLAPKKPRRRVFSGLSMLILEHPFKDSGFDNPYSYKKAMEARFLSLTMEQKIDYMKRGEERTLQANS